MKYRTTKHETICTGCGRAVQWGLQPTVYVRECANCTRPQAA
jgi:hypothetical protein